MATMSKRKRKDRIRDCNLTHYVHHTKIFLSLKTSNFASYHMMKKRFH
jgi:hypothetical protein